MALSNLERYSFYLADDKTAYTTPSCTYAYSSTSTATWGTGSTDTEDSYLMFDSWRDQARNVTVIEKMIEVKSSMEGVKAYVQLTYSDDGLDTTSTVGVVSMKLLSTTDDVTFTQIGSTVNYNLYARTRASGYNGTVDRVVLVLGYGITYGDDIGKFGFGGWWETNTTAPFKYYFICNAMSKPTDIEFYESLFTDYIPPSEDWGPDSTPQGGDGTFDDSSDDIPFVDLPNFTVMGTGMISLFEVGYGELASFASWLWDWDIWTSLSRLNSSPIDYILNLSVVPFDVTCSTQKTIKLGNSDSGVMANIVQQQYYTLDCGEFDLAGYFGAYLDNSPHSTIELHLPYKGFVPLDIDMFMGGRISIKYHMDVFTGTGTVQVLCVRDTLNSVVYEFSVDFGCNIPLNGTNYASQMQSMATGALGLGASMLGGMGAVGLAMGAIGVASSKPTVERAGGCTGGSGFLSGQHVYFVLNRPRMSKPQGFKEVMGHPSNVYSSLASLSGFTQVEDLITDGITCPTDELDDIIEKLKNGVYL